MSIQPKFKKFALSALLLSAVVAPTAAGAAEKSPVVPTNVVAESAVTVTTFASTVSKINPLELAETYAPTTVDDWKKTLEQYDKITGNIEFEMADSIVTIGIADQVEGEGAVFIDTIKEGEVDFERFEIAEKMHTSLITVDTVKGNSKPTQALKADFIGLGNLYNNWLSIDMTKANIGTDQAFEVNVAELSAANSPFIEAQISLNDAVESKDAPAIKDALAELLVQYKQQIAELELAE